MKYVGLWFFKKMVAQRLGSHVRNMVWATIYYKYLAHEHNKYLLLGIYRRPNRNSQDKLRIAQYVFYWYLDNLS